MDQTYEYMRPAMRSGLITTGMFIAAGSVAYSFDLFGKVPFQYSFAGLNFESKKLRLEGWNAEGQRIDQAVLSVGAD
jgi:hypothetical protein